MPARMRQYEAVQRAELELGERIDHNWVLQDFTSGTLRPKHQKQLLKLLGAQCPWDRLTAGMLWAANLRAVREAVKEIMENAQGESALEEFLNEVSELWDNTRFDMVDFRKKCWLVRNWDVLMAQMADQLSQVQSMKQSPYFAVFAQEALQWEDRLTKAAALFDIMIDIQRRWVYLEGVFMNSADVQAQLGYQFRKFKTFDREFVKLMRGIRQKPQIEFWVQDERNLLARLESDANILNAIQKALGDYLETQRQAFPRFYFVGDEDLLEIIGNGKDPRQIIKHLPKMFAGLASLELDKARPELILGMASAEGERVMFSEPVDTQTEPAVQQWLRAVERQMMLTLAGILEEAVKADVSGRSGEAFFEWASRFPAQVVLLAQQVRWSRKVEGGLRGQGGSEAREFSAGESEEGGRLEDTLGDIEE
eukprot:750375_1